MAKAKYDVGDILTWCNDGNCYATVVIVRWHTKSMYVEGISLEQHTDYDLFIKSKGENDFKFIREAPEAVFYNYKVVGHIDISGMSNKEIETELVYAIATVWNEHRIAYAVQNHWALMKFREPKEESKCANLTDKLKEECKQKQKHLDLANNKIFELKKEVDSLKQTLHNDSTRIHKNLSVMGFTEDAIHSIMYSEFNYMLGTE